MLVPRMETLGAEKLSINSEEKCSVHYNGHMTHRILLRYKT